MKMKLVRFKETGREYAMPLTQDSVLPCFMIYDGSPFETLYNFSDLNLMIVTGIAEVVGDLNFTLNLAQSK